MKAQNAIFGGSAAISESPKDADVTTHDLSHGDVLVFASDGVWDNLSPMNTLSLLSPIMEKRGYWSPTDVNAEALRPAESLDGSSKAAKEIEDLPTDLAYAVMKAAKQAGLDTRRDGPFAKEVHRYYPGEDWHGGKHDDIAVIVVVVVQDGSTITTEEKTIKAKL